ncbi:MAG TPA: hypothetical protein VJI75_05450 [Candidatus Nanoarchaeia archaeon]|nr:hypothetical protein [Candidatus Nanoarchaeia archaeon]
MPKRGLWLVITVVFFLAVFSENASAGCCVFESIGGGGCISALDASECGSGSTFDSNSCDQVANNACKIGCCCDLIGTQDVYRLQNQCPADKTFSPLNTIPWTNQNVAQKPEGVDCAIECGVPAQGCIADVTKQCCGVSVVEKTCNDAEPTRQLEANPDFTSECDAACVENDPDSDGVFANDNCPNQQNPDQADSNANGRGDACDTDTGTDADGDTYISLETGGNDCDDTNIDVYPGAAEDCDNSLDDDCDDLIDTLDGDCAQCNHDGVKDSGEECDVEAGSLDIGTASCLSLGFSGGGDLSCTADCKYDTSECLSAVQLSECNDGLDNDGNGCADFPGDNGCESPSDMEESGGECASCGNNIIDTPNFERVYEVCDGDEGCLSGGSCTEDCLSCGYECGNPALPELVSVASVKGERAFSLAWTIDQRCSPSGVKIMRCNTEEEECVPGITDIRTTLQGVPQSFKDEDSEITGQPDNEETQYCYQVIAVYDGNDAVSEVKCVTVGDDQCLENGATEFCDKEDGKEQRMECNALNKVSEIEDGDCNEKDEESEGIDYFCAGPDASGNTACRQQSSCDFCNDIFALFGQYAKDLPVVYKVPFEDMFNDVKCPELPVCYFDYSKTNADLFLECKNVKSCYDYRSKDACVGPDSGTTVSVERNVRVFTPSAPGAAGDNCGIGGTQGCEWAESDKAFAELGVGACRPVDTKRQECSACTNPEFYYSQGNDAGFNNLNNIFGACSVATCPLYGDCFFTDPNCVSSGEAGCQDYDSEQDCGANAVIDTEWIEGIKLGGDNSIITPSTDYLSFGVCKWVEAEEECIKDADNNLEDDCKNPQGIIDQSCKKDNTPPNTEILQSGYKREGDKLLLGKDIFLRTFINEADVTTYFCIDNAGECYPQQATTCGIQFNAQGMNGDYLLRYFSEDNAKNLEQVKSMPVSIDSSPAEITITDSVQSYANPVIGTSSKTITIAMDSSEIATCSAHLETDDGGIVVPEASIKQESKTSFSRTYYDLEDDRYWFVYECFDESKNKASGEYSILVDSNRVHNDGAPYGPLSEKPSEFSITTDEDAECRFAQSTGQTPAFDNMVPMSSTGSTSHSQTLTGINENFYYSYDVKCKFADGKIEGERNDRVRFSIDKKAPVINTVSTTEAYAFDSSLSYGGAQTLFIQCVDNYFKETFSVKHMDSGCTEVQYSLTGEEGSYEPMPSPKDLAGPFNFADTVWYKATDNAGNPVSGAINPTQESVARSLELKIYPSPPLSPLPSVGKKEGETDQYEGSISYGYYEAIIISATPLNKLSAALTVGGVDVPLDYLFSTEFGKEWHYSFYIPLSYEEGGFGEGKTLTSTLTAEGDLVTNGAVCSEAGSHPEDEPISIEVKFNVDTNLPEISLEPKLSDYDYDTKYKNVFENPDEDDYYFTNETQLFISGVAKNPEVTTAVRFASGNGEGWEAQLGTPKAEYFMTSGASEDPANTFTTLSQAKKGESQIMIRGDIDIGNSDFIDTGTKREEYGKYRTYYPISQVASIGSNTKIILADPLEKNIAAGAKPKKYLKQFPNDWFGGIIALLPGENHVFVEAVGLSRIGGDIIGFILFSDPAPPEVISYRPRLGTTNEKRPTIFIQVKELAEGSGILGSSVKLSVNGRDYKSKLQYSSVIEGLFNVTTISFTPDTDWADGSYNVVFNGTDKARNNFITTGNNKLSWTFKIDSNAPSAPILELEQGEGTWHLASSSWYSKQSPKFKITFKDEDPVIMTALYLEAEGNDLNFSGAGAINCLGSNPADNVYHCYAPSLAPEYSWSADGLVLLQSREDFNLLVRAYKKLLDNRRSPEALYSLDTMVIDNVAPRITVVKIPEKIRKNANFTLEIEVENEKHPLNGTLFFDNKWFQLTQTESRGNHYFFRWKVPDYNSVTDIAKETTQPLTLRIADYAGNYDTHESSTFLDLTPPDLSLLNVSVNPGVIVPYNYINLPGTRFTDVIINGTYHGIDMTALAMIPGDFLPTKKKFSNASASARLFKDKEVFSLPLILNGTLNKTALKDYRIIVTDAAGYVVEKPFSILSDLQSPYAVSSEIR